MKIKNMTSPRSDNPVVNQFVIRSGPFKWFQSYDTMIARVVWDGLSISANKLVLDIKMWDCSPTTSKYRNLFTGLTTAETKAGIKDGSIRLADLNK